MKSGPTDADIVVLGEAPGTEEIADGAPFVDAAGRMLFDQILPAGDIRRDKCLVTYVHWTQPPGVRWETLNDLGTYDRQVTDLVSQCAPKAIIAVGEHALDFCLQGTADVPKARQESVYKWRGSILTDTKAFPGIPVIPMIHPRAVLRSSGYKEDDGTDEGSERGSLHFKALCQLDARRVRQVVNDPTFRPPKRTIHHPGNSSWDELANMLSNIPSERPLAFDIETFAHTITCVGVSWDPHEALVVPFTEVDGWSVQQRTELILQLAEVLKGPAPKIGQNLDYDVQHLAQINIGVSNVWLDTAVAHSIMYPEIPHDLAMLTSIYTLQPYFKEMRKEVETDQYDEAQWTYNGLDCCVTHEIGIKLSDELESK